MSFNFRLAGSIIGLAMVASACASSDTSTEPATSAPPDTAGATSTPAPPPTTVGSTTSTPEPAPSSTAAPEEAEPEELADTLDTEALVTALAADDLGGRNNGTPGSLAAQELLIGQLAGFAEPAFPDRSGKDRFIQPFIDGANVLAMIPGGDLADETVIIGAHYDHLGEGECNNLGLSDLICNGATDNATGVAAAMSIARSIATADNPPRRTVLVAFWDREEDGLLGAAHYVADPLLALDTTVAYVNFDIQGANLLPSLGNVTLMIGAETGGPNLIESATAATSASSLDTFAFSLLFGQGRSDHAVLVSAGVPSVFFSDANSGCYHTVKDDLDAVDFAKLDQQIATALALSEDLVATDTPPEIDKGAPVTTFADAASLLSVVEMGEPDFGLFDTETEATSRAFAADLRTIVDAGSESFDGAATGVLLGGAQAFVEDLSELDCGIGS